MGKWGDIMPYQFRNLYPQFTQRLSSWTAENEIYRNQPVYSKKPAWNGLYTSLVLEAGTYTFSIFVRTAIQRTVAIYPLPNGGSTDGISLDSSGDIVLSASADWQRISFTFTLSTQKELWLRVEATTDSSTKLYVSAPQLESGSAMTLFEGYHSTWYIDDSGELTHTNFPVIPERAFQLPLPKSVWRNAEYNHEYLYSELMPEVPANGAFANASELTQISIPPSVKYIGEEAFKYTKLKSVTIASDCTYFDTSFPEGCEIKFY